MVQRFQCPFHMSQIEYLQGVYHQHRRTEERVENSRRFFRRHGMDDSITGQLLGRGQDYLKKTVPLPAAYRRLSHGQDIAIGARSFRVFTGAGHSPEQVMLYCAGDNLFLSADQVLSKISPNVSVWAHEPNENALGAYLRSLRHLADTLPEWHQRLARWTSTQRVLARPDGTPLREGDRLVQADLAATRRDLSMALRHVSVVRYDAFGDMGGRFSFSAALLDDQGDGLVITSIHARSETRTYLKGLHAGTSDIVLSPEEDQAVRIARGQDS